MAAGPKELNEDLLRALPDTGPVVMINQLKFKARSDDGDGSGWDAYQRYSRGVSPLIRALGGTILWAGEVETTAYGDPAANHWDYAVLVRYPSRAAFLEMVTSEAYAAANVHCDNGVAEHLILASRETFSKFPPP